MNLAFRHLPNLRFFIGNPVVNVAASRDPSMLGCLIGCLSEAAVPAVEKLIVVASERCAAFLEFACDFKVLDARLRLTNGFRLDGYCAELPQSPSGMLDLVYDLNKNLRICVIEELMYKALLAPEGDYELCLNSSPQSQRPIFTSTRRIESEDLIFGELHFNDDAIDALAAMRLHPSSVAEIAEGLGIPGEERGFFRSFFCARSTDQAKPELFRRGRAREVLRTCLRAAESGCGLHSDRSADSLGAKRHLRSPDVR